MADITKPAKASEFASSSSKRVEEVLRAMETFVVASPGAGKVLAVSEILKGFDNVKEEARVIRAAIAEARAISSGNLIGLPTRASEERQKGKTASHSAGKVRDLKIELQEQRDRLRVENELLKSQVAEARREAARETQRFDQLLMQNDKLLDCLRDRDSALDMTTALLVEQSKGQLRMIERYEGVVEHVHGDSATIAFEIDDDVVEHMYRRSQFIDGQLPEEGDRITVYVHVVHGSVENADDSSTETDELDEHPEYERKKITGPIEF
jgi:hypothetical protein